MLSVVVVRFSMFLEEAFMTAHDKIFGSADALREACKPSKDDPSTLPYKAREELKMLSSESASPEQVLHTFADRKAKFEEWLRYEVQGQSVMLGMELFQNANNTKNAETCFRFACNQESMDIFVTAFKWCFGFDPPLALGKNFHTAVMDSFMTAKIEASEENVAEVLKTIRYVRKNPAHKCSLLTEAPDAHDLRELHNETKASLKKAEEVLKMFYTQQGAARERLPDVPPACRLNLSREAPYFSGSLRPIKVFEELKELIGYVIIAGIDGCRDLRRGVERRFRHWLRGSRV